jgi:hypothetical protein
VNWFECNSFSVTPEMLRTIESIGLRGWKLIKRGGRNAEVIKGKYRFRIKYSVFAGMRTRGLIEGLVNSEHFVLTAKAEAAISGKWPYSIIFAIPPEWTKARDKRENWKAIKRGEVVNRNTAYDRILIRAKKISQSS